MLFVQTSSQRMFFQQDTLGNRCACFFFSKDYPAVEIERAVNRIIETNDALRMRPQGEMIKVVDYEYTTIQTVAFKSESDMNCYFIEEMKRELDGERYLFKLFIVLLEGQIGVVCIIHHSLVDGFSIELFSRKLIRYLEGEGLSECSFIPHMNSEIAYHDSAAYLRDNKFWNNELVPLPEMHCFGMSGDRHVENETLIIPSDLAKMLSDYCEQRGISESGVLNTVLAILLHRVCGHDRFTIGLPIIGRTSESDYETMGLFMHIVPLVVDVADGTFEELVASVTEKQYSLYRHYRFAAYDIQKMCLGGQLSHKNLFDVTAEYSVAQNNPDVESYELFGDQLSVALEVHFQRQSVSCLRIRMRHRDKIVNLLPAFAMLLEQCISIPERRVSQFTITEHICSIGEHVEFPEVGLYGLVERNTVGSIIEGDRTYNLSDLKRAAEKVDVAVRGSKRVIGVLCDRSYYELAAIYGIIRGGNAYLPISPEYPAERIRLILDQSGCNTVLVQCKYANMVDGGLIIEDVLEGDDPDFIPSVASTANDTLYVIFTSGSTGTPKGAMVSNRSAVNRIQWMCKKYFDKDTVVMLKTPYTFDVSVWEIFGFALGGFSLYILPPEDHYRQDRIIEHIRIGQITDLHFVPTVFRYFLDSFEKDGGSLPSLRNIFLSGEALTASLVNEAPAPVHNLYGPTECAVDVTWYDSSENEVDPIPIGKPIDNCQIFVFDKYLQPLPIGVIGQICIGGVQVGQGYINNPEKSAQSFVDNPFGENRLYLTGDLGYWRDDGQLIYVGRNDQQVKINGQRIELGEIEATLSMYTDSNAVVVLENRLIAFYTGAERSDLREKLSYKLPRHLVPHSFVHMDELPLTSNGKIDRTILSRTTLAFTPPQSDVEVKICALFSRVLGFQQIGRDDSFYDLGGTSLGMMELLCSEPLKDLSPTDFMTHPTPAALADLLLQSKPVAHLTQLYSPKDASSAIVLFTYGGGDAAAYTALVEEFRKRNAPVALFFVPWGCDYDAVAENIRKLTVPVQFYSHCAGAVIAMKLLDQLNVDAANPVVSRYVLGANIPPADLNNFWESVPDETVLSILRKAGMPELPREQRKNMLCSFRTNTEEYFRYYKEKTTQTPIEITLLLGQDDVFTPDYDRAEELWMRFVTRVTKIQFLAAPTHYFQSSHSADLADILLYGER